MFSASLEIVLTIAYREAVSRRHAYLTLEHLLYALAHDPEGERILDACGADLPRLRRRSRLPREVGRAVSRGQEGARTDVAFRRVLQTAVLHVQSAGAEVMPATSWRPCSSSPSRRRRGCSRPRASRGSNPELHLARHHQVPAMATEHDDVGRGAPAGAGEDGAPSARDPLAAYASNLTERARGGTARSADRAHDRARSGRSKSCAGGGRTIRSSWERPASERRRWPKVWRFGCSRTTCHAVLQGAEVFALDTSALLAGTRFRGDFEERFKAVIDALQKRRLPILFIDEIHSTVGAGATTGGTMDLATMIKPVLTAGEVKVVGSTTFEEFKHIEKDRALARRLQKIVDRRAVHRGDGQDPRGAASPVRGAPRGAINGRGARGGGQAGSRHLRDYRLPDSAIDIIDEAGA